MKFRVTKFNFYFGIEIVGDMNFVNLRISTKPLRLASFSINPAKNKAAKFTDTGKISRQTSNRLYVLHYPPPLFNSSFSATSRFAVDQFASDRRPNEFETPG